MIYDTSAIAILGSTNNESYYRHLRCIRYRHVCALIQSCDQFHAVLGGEYLVKKLES